MNSEFQTLDPPRTRTPIVPGDNDTIVAMRQKILVQMKIAFPNIGVDITKDGPELYQLWNSRQPVQSALMRTQSEVWRLWTDPIEALKSDLELLCHLPRLFHISPHQLYHGEWLGLCIILTQKSLSPSAANAHSSPPPRTGKARAAGSADQKTTPRTDGGSRTDSNEPHSRKTTVLPGVDYDEPRAQLQSPRPGPGAFKMGAPSLLKVRLEEWGRNKSSPIKSSLPSQPASAGEVKPPPATKGAGFLPETDKYFSGGGAEICTYTSGPVRGEKWRCTHPVVKGSRCANHPKP